MEITRDFLLQLYHICSVAGGVPATKVSFEAMWAEWTRIYNQKVLPLSKVVAPSILVIKMHEYFRVTSRVGYATGAWNLFLAVTNREPCNCVCSTYFLLLCCLSVGLFGPGKFVGGLVPKHMVVVGNLYDTTYYFETTSTCRTRWSTMKQLFDQTGVHAAETYSTVPELVSVFAAIAANTIQDEYAAYTLLQKYPSDTLYYLRETFQVAPSLDMELEYVARFLRRLQQHPELREFYEHWLTTVGQDITEKRIHLPENIVWIMESLRPSTSA